jgi:hypothetical protein
MPTKIFPEDPQGLRYLFNMKSPKVHPDEVDLSQVIPTVDVGFNGYAKLPVDDDQICSTLPVTVRTSTEVDPTIERFVVIPGNTATPQSELLYGVGNNCYIPVAEIDIIATDPDELQTSMGEFPWEIYYSMSNPSSNDRCVDIFNFDGVSDIAAIVTAPGGAGSAFVPGLIRLPLSPIFLPYPYAMAVGVRSKIHNLATFGSITLEGLSVYYTAHAWKIPLGAEPPFIRNR